MNAVMKEKLVAVGLFLFAMVYGYGSMQLRLGSAANPGAGFIPAIVAISLLAATAYYLYQVFSAKQGKADVGEQSEKNHIVIYLSACLVIYPLLLSVIDFWLSTSLLVFCSLRLLEYENLWRSLGVAVLFPAIIYIIFARILSVSLPTGFLELLLLRIGS